MIEPCPTCDKIGPDRLPLTAALRDLHRDLHNSIRVLVAAFAPFAEEQRNYTLAGPSKGDSK